MGVVRWLALLTVAALTVQTKSDPDCGDLNGWQECLCSNDEYQVRRLHRGLWVSTTVHDESLTTAYNNARFRLSKFLNGDNDQGTKIQRESPYVLQTHSGKEEQREVTVSVLLPKKLWKMPPIPTDGKVVMEIVPETIMYVRIFPQKAAGFVADREAKRFFQLLSKNEEPIIGQDDYYYIFQYKRSPTKPSVNEIAIFAMNKHTHEFYSRAEGLDHSDMRLPKCIQSQCDSHQDTCGVHSAVTWSHDEEVINVDLERECQKDHCASAGHGCHYKLEKSYTPSTEVRKYFEQAILEVPVHTCNAEDVDALGQPIFFEYMKDLGKMKEFSMMHSEWTVMAKENTWNKKSCPNQFLYRCTVDADFKGEETEAVHKQSWKSHKMAAKCLAGYADANTLFTMAKRLHNDLHRFGVDHCAGNFVTDQFYGESRLFDRFNEVKFDVKPSCNWYEGDPIVDFRHPEDRLESVEPLKVGHHCDHSDDEDHHHSDCLVPERVEQYGKIHENFYNKAAGVFVSIKDCTAESAKRKAMSIILKYINGYNKEEVAFKMLKPVLTMDPRTLGHEMSECDVTYTTVAFLPEEHLENPPEPVDNRIIVIKADDFAAYQMPYHVPAGEDVFGERFLELARNMTLSMRDLDLDGKFFHTGGVADYDLDSDVEGEHFKEIWVLKQSYSLLHEFQKAIDTSVPDVLKPLFYWPEEQEDRTYPEGCPGDDCFVPEILGENAGYIEHKFHVDYWACVQSTEHSCGHPSVSRSMLKATADYFNGNNEAGTKADQKMSPAVTTHTTKTPPDERAAGTCKDTFEICMPVPKGFSDGEPPAPNNDAVVIKKGQSLQTYVVKRDGPIAQGAVDEALKNVRLSLDKHGMLYDQSVDVVYTYHGWNEDEEHQNFYAGYAMAPWGDGLGMPDIVNMFPPGCPNGTCFIPEKIGEHQGFLEHKFSLGNFICGKGEVEDCANPQITAPIFSAVRGYFEGKNEAEATAGIIQPSIFSWTYRTDKAEIAAGKCRDFYEFCVPVPRDFMEKGIPAPTEDNVYIKKGATLQTFVTRKMGFRHAETYAAAIERVRTSIDLEGLGYDQSVHVYYGYGGLAEAGDFGVLFAGFAMPPWGDGLANEAPTFPDDCPNDNCFLPTTIGEHDGLIEHKIDAKNWVCYKKNVTDCTSWGSEEGMYDVVRKYFSGSNTAGLKAEVINPAITAYITYTNETDMDSTCNDVLELCIPLPREYQKKEPPAPTDDRLYIKKRKGGLQTLVTKKKGLKTIDAINDSFNQTREGLDSHGLNYDSSVDLWYSYTKLPEDRDYQVFFTGYADPDWTDGVGKGLTAFPEDCPGENCYVPEVIGDYQTHKFTAKNWVCYQSKVYNCGHPELDPYTFRAVRSYFEGNNEAGITAEIILPGITTYIARTSQADRAAGICHDVFEFCVPFPRKLQDGVPPAPNSRKVYIKSDESLQAYVRRVSAFPTQERINKNLAAVRKSLDKTSLPHDQTANVFYNFAGPVEDRDNQVFFTGYPKAPWGDGLATVVEEFPPNCPNKNCFLPEIVGTYGPFLEHKFEAENWVCVKRHVIHCGEPELSPSMYKSIRRYFQGSNDAGKKADVIVPGITTYIANTTEMEKAGQLCRDMYEFCVPLPEDFTKETIPAPTEQGVYIKKGGSLQTFVTSRIGYRTQQAIKAGLKDVRKRLDREQLGYDQTVDVVYTYAGPSESHDYQIFFVGYAKAPWGNGHGDTPTTFPDTCPSDTCYLPEILAEENGFAEHKFNAEQWACVRRNVTDCGNPQFTPDMAVPIRGYFSGENDAELTADVIFPGVSSLICLTTKAEKAAGICKDVFEFCVPLPKSFLEGDAPPAPTGERVYIKKGHLEAYTKRITGYRTQKAIGKALKKVRKSLDKYNMDYDQTVDVVYTYGGPNENKRYEVFYAGYAKAPWGNGRRQTVVDMPSTCPSDSCFVPETKEAHNMIEHTFDVENWVCVKRNVIHCGPPELSPSIFEGIREYLSGGNEAGKKTDAFMHPGVKTKTAKTGSKAAAGFECHDTFEFCVPLPEEFNDLPAPTVGGVYLKTGAKLHTYVTKRIGYESQTAIDSALHHVKDCLHRHAGEFDETVDVVYSFAGPAEAHDYKTFYVGYAKAPWGDGLGNGVMATPTDCPSDTCFLPEIMAEHNNMFEHKFGSENWVCVKRVIEDCSKPDFSTSNFKYIRKYFSGNNAARLVIELIILPGVTTYIRKTSQADIAAGICKDVYEFCVPVPRDLKGEAPAPTDDEVYIKKGATLQTYVTRTQDRRTQTAINSALSKVREDLNTHDLHYDQTVDVVYSYHGPSEDHDYQVFFAGYAKAPWGNGLGKDVVTFPDDCATNNNCFLPETLSEEDGFIEHKFDAENWVCEQKDITDCRFPDLDPAFFSPIRNYFKGENEVGLKAEIILPGITSLTFNGSCPVRFEFCVPLPKDKQEGELPAPKEEGVIIKKGASLQAYVTRRTGFRDHDAIREALHSVRTRLDKNGLEYDQTVDVAYTYAGPTEYREHQVFFAGYAKAPWGDGLGKGVVDYPSDCPSDTCYLPETVGEKEGFVEHKFEAENWVCVQEDVRMCGHPQPSMATFRAVRGYFSGNNSAKMTATIVFPGMTSVTLSPTVLRDRAIGICNDVFEFCVPLPKDWPQDEPPTPTDDKVYVKKGASMQAYVTRRVGFKTQTAIDEALESVKHSLERHGLQYDQSVDVVYDYNGPTENQGYGVFFVGYAKAPWGNGFGEGVVDWPSTCPSDTCFLPEVVSENEGFIEHKFAIENWVCEQRHVIECGHPLLMPSMHRGIRRYFSGNNEAKATAETIVPGPTSYIAKTSTYEADIGICNDVFEFCVPVPPSLNDGVPPEPTEEGVVLKKGSTLHTYVTRRTGYLNWNVVDEAKTSVKNSLNAHGLDFDQTVDVVYNFNHASEIHAYQVNFIGYAKAPWGNGLRTEVKDHPDDCPSDTCFLPETVSEKDGFIEHKFTAENWVCVERNVIDCGHPELSASMIHSLMRYKMEAGIMDVTLEPALTAVMSKSDKTHGSCKDVFEFCVPLPKKFQEADPPAPTEKGVILRKGVNLQTYVVKRTGYRTQEAIDGALHSVHESLEGSESEYDQTVDVVYSFAGPIENTDYQVFYAGYAKGWANEE
ncbi:uncharacterized protein LOC144918797 [Branchiostoma floridae x Branchiostoma belcheri]